MKETNILKDESGLKDELNFCSYNGEIYIKHISFHKIDAPKKIWVNFDEIILNESKDFLNLISKNLGLGKVSLKRDKCRIYPPCFHITVNQSLSADEMIKLDNNVMTQLYNILKKEFKLEYFKKFFVELDFF